MSCKLSWIHYIREKQEEEKAAELADAQSITPSEGRSVTAR